MLDELVDFVLHSRWAYVLLFGVAVGDAFLPIFPSEAAAIAAGVMATTEMLEIEYVIAAAAAGAIVGDNITYLAGRRLGRPAADRLFRRGRVRRLRRRPGAIPVGSASSSTSDRRSRD